MSTVPRQCMGSSSWVPAKATAKDAGRTAVCSTCGQTVITTLDRTGKGRRLGYHEVTL